MKYTALGAILAISLLAFPQTSQAFGIVSCPDLNTCHGNEYYVNFTNMGGGNYELTMSVTILNTYIGTPGSGGDVFAAIALKNFADSFAVNGPVTYSASGPDAGPFAPVSWVTSLFELNADGCGGPGGGSNELCIWGGSDPSGTEFSIGDTLEWTVPLLITGLHDTADLKFLYLEEKCNPNKCWYKSTGSLGSFQIPEPSSLALMGLALVLMGVLGAAGRRRASIR